MKRMLTRHMTVAITGDFRVGDQPIKLMLNLPRSTLSYIEPFRAPSSALDPKTIRIPSIPINLAQWIIWLYRVK